MVYEYPHMGGLPLGTVEPEEDILQNAGALAAWRACECILAIDREEGGVLIFGHVFKHYVDGDAQRCIHALIGGNGENLCLKREDVAHVLLKATGQHFLKEHQELWVDFLDVVVWFQYESNFMLALWMDEIVRRFIPDEAMGKFFQLSQMVYQCTQRNCGKKRQALRRAFRKALPQLLPGATIARKKPGYALKKGHADFFLEREGKLSPTQLLDEPVSQNCVESLRKAILGYQAETGYFVAPGIEEGVALDDNMVFVEFG
jgi:hypothetical protein